MSEELRADRTRGHRVGRRTAHLLCETLLTHDTLIAPPLPSHPCDRQRIAYLVQRDLRDAATPFQALPV
jgi:hypothetical protein